jgi:hypothetical protein
MSTLSNTKTAATQYDEHLAIVSTCAEKIVDITLAGGNMRNWLNDAVNDSWVSGITLQMWLARALNMCPGYRGQAVFNIDNLAAG